jgi:predicted dehydrogenase
VESVDKPIRLGIIGAGNIVKTRHLPGFAKVEDCKVVAVHNRRRANAEAVAKEWKVPNVVDSPEAVYGRDDVNAVLIGTTPYLHRDLALAALAAGKHVFCQARMARTVAEARDMLAAAKAHPDLVTMVCPAPHVFPGQRFVERLIREGALGELRLVRFRHLSDATLSPDGPYHWRMDREISGYNVLTLGMYAEILNRWVGRARTVAASGRLFTTKRKDPESGELRPVQVPESVGVTGELENGAHYVYTFSSVAAYSGGDQIELYGTKAALIYEVPTHRILMGKVDPTRTGRPGLVTVKEPPQPVEIPAAERGEWRVEADFASAIRYGTPVFPNFQDGVDYMDFVEAVGRSMEEGRTMYLPLP